MELGAPQHIGMDLLAEAKRRSDAAREQYKRNLKIEQTSHGENRYKRLKKHDSSLTENQKYHRRLRKNQDSSAAARYAHQVYVEALEGIVAASEGEQSFLSWEVAMERMERDNLAKKVLELKRELFEANDPSAVEIIGSTEALLEGVSRALEERNESVSLSDFRDRIMGVQCAPAL